MAPQLDPTPDVQRDGVGATSTGREDGLTEFEPTAQARRIERLADADIIMTLQLQNFDPESDEWRELQDALIEYGFQVFRVWAVTGRLRERAFQHSNGRGVRGKHRIPEGLTLSEDQATELSIDLNMTAVEAFRTKTLMDPKRTWRMDGGASIKTYYTGRCLMELPDVFEKWQREDAFDVETFEDLSVVTEHRRRSPRPEAIIDHTQTRSEQRSAIAASVPDLEAQEIFQYMDQGYSQEEIAELMAVSTGRPYTVAAVESRLYRARKEAPANLAHATRDRP